MGGAISLMLINIGLLSKCEHNKQDPILVVSSIALCAIPISLVSSSWFLGLGFGVLGVLRVFGMIAPARSSLPVCLLLRFSVFGFRHFDSPA